MTEQHTTRQAGHDRHAEGADQQGHGGHEHDEGHGGHGDHGGHEGHVAMFRRLFWIMLALSVPTVLTSGMFADLLGYQLPDCPGCAGSPRCWGPSCTSGAAGPSTRGRSTS